MTTWSCSNCGGENPEGTRFCGHCGAAAEVAWTCATCSAENPANTKFCGNCGTARAAPAPVAPPPQPPAPEPQAQDDSVAEALKSFVAPAVAERLLETGGLLADERRLITSLFADVSGFTSLSERLDPEQLIEVIDPLITSLSEIVGRYGGTVDKYAGDALLALFGAPIAHEDDAERALLVAIDMHREILRLREVLPHGEVLGLHIGVNSGHAIARVQGSQVRLDYNVLGDAVNLAQRLESVAPLGETYVSEETYRLTSHRFEFESVGELTLKGKAEPVPGWRLIGEREQLEHKVGRLIGRSDELAILREALDTLGEGQGGIILLSGDAGIGKARLTAELQELAGERGRRWLKARCLSYGAALAYWPFTDLLQREPDLIEAAGEEHKPFIARMRGEPAPELDELEPEAFRRGLHSAFAGALGALSDATPLVLAITDLHWADPSSLALLDALTSVCAERPILLAATTRPEAIATLDGLASKARAIELRPFGESDVEEFILAILDATLPKGLAPAVAERTGGNPLFIEQTIASLIETGTLTRDDEGWAMKAGWDALSLPASIENVLAARIDMLPHTTASVLQEASVIGRLMYRELLTAVVADIPDAESRIGDLVQKGFLEQSTDEDGSEVITFHNALIVDAAYGRLLRRTRREMHVRVAETAEKLYGSGDGVVDLLAQHYYLGEVAEKALPYLMRAGARAKSLYANEEAIMDFSRAVELAPDDTGAKLELADLYDLTGSYDEALRLFREVRESDGHARAWLGIATTLRKQGEYADALAVIDEAVSTKGFQGEELSALRWAQGWTLDVSGQSRTAAEVLRAGLAEAGARRDVSVGRLMFQLTRVLTLLGEYDEALAQGLEAQQIFTDGDDLRGLGGTLRVLGDTYRYLNRLDEAAAVLRQALEIDERIGNIEELAGCLLNLGVVEATRGDPDGALASFRRAVAEFEAIGHASGRALAYSNLAYMLSLVEEYDEALHYCELALEVARAVGHTYTIAATYDTIAAIALAREQYDEAVVKGEEAAELHLEIGAVREGAEALERAATAAEQGGDEERARSLRERARSLALTNAS